MRIAVVGGTGWAGRHVVQEAERAGHEVVVVARSTGADLLTGDGLAERLAGCDAVVDVSNVDTVSRRKAVAFFEQATTHLVEAAGAAGVGHLVVLSVVGIDRVDFGYYLGKRRQEQIALDSGLPVTVLRATQFHEFAAQRLAARVGPLVPVPTMRCLPVAAAEVAAHLVRLAEGPALGRAPELAGPEELLMVDLVRRLAHARGEHVVVLPLRAPGGVGRGMMSGALLPAEDGPRGTTTFEEWLEHDQAPDRLERDGAA